MKRRVFLTLLAAALSLGLVFAIPVVQLVKITHNDAVSFNNQTNTLSMDTNGNLTLDGFSLVQSTWTNLIPGVITQRLTTLVLTNKSL